MIFFELASSAFTAVLYGIVLTVFIVGLLYVILRQLCRGAVHTIPFYVIGVVLFAVLLVQQTLMFGAFKAKGYVDNVAEYVYEVIDLKDGLKESANINNVDPSLTEKVKEEFPMVSLFVNMDKIEEYAEDIDDLEDTVPVIKNEFQSALNYYILRRILWSLGVIVVSVVLVCLIESRGGTSGRRGHYSSSRSKADFRSNTLRSRRFR